MFRVVRMRALVPKALEAQQLLPAAPKLPAGQGLVQRAQPQQLLLHCPLHLRAKDRLAVLPSHTPATKQSSLLESTLSPSR